ncbi:DUF4139 domain-containing protein [Planococcus sp. X10-3]|uniref:DUF4139 domain-containing protein n=1 Tax=Planococcus sp. X10-3 TaxID=3061240 RepID=UPI003BB1FA83
MGFQTGKASRKSLAMTVYNNGFASVKEIRSLTMEAGVNLLVIEDLPEQIEADSFYIKGVSVLEQTFENAPINREQLLKKHIGRLITIRNTDFGEEMKLRLLAAVPDLIGKNEETGEIIINPTGDVVLAPDEERMQLHPAVHCRIEPVAVQSDIELFYLTAGISWNATYTAELHADKIYLAGWITIRNYTGTNFENCTVKAIAGNVRRDRSTFPLMENEASRSGSFGGGTEEYGFADMNVYKIDRPISISDGQTKQIPFLHTQDFDVQRNYKIEKGKSNAAVHLQFGKTVGGGSKLPLPKGIMKFYERDKEGGLEFIGEDSIEYTPASEKLNVKIGEANYLTTKAREKSRKIVDGHEYVTFEYQIKNSKAENVGILLEHIVDDAIWEMESSTHDYELMDSHKLEFHVRLRAGNSVDVEFTYKVKHTQ